MLDASGRTSDIKIKHEELPAVASTSITWMDIFIDTDVQLTYDRLIPEKQHMLCL